MTDDYMPDPERSVAYKLLDPGFKKVFAFGAQFGQIGYIIADSWEDAYEELQEHAYEVDGPCDHGNDPELELLRLRAEHTKDWEPVWRWIDDCDCESCPSGYVWMVDNWWHRETTITPLALVKALREHAQRLAGFDGQWVDPAEVERLDQLIEWYEPEEDDDEDQ